MGDADRAAARPRRWCSIATRHDPLLSPDSITYLSAADHIRAGHGLTDFTGKPLAVFGPIYPLLLAPGGRSLVWATIVGVDVDRRRQRADGGAAASASSPDRRARPARWHSVPARASCGWHRWCGARRRTRPSRWRCWSCCRAQPLTTRTAAVGGLLAGVGFLTRYAGVGLIATGAVMVAASAWRADRARRSWCKRLRSVRRAARSASARSGSSATSIETGQPLGPRFEGGATEPLYSNHPAGADRHRPHRGGRRLVGDSAQSADRHGRRDRDRARWPLWRCTAARPLLSISASPRSRSLRSSCRSSLAASPPTTSNCG